MGYELKSSVKKLFSALLYFAVFAIGVPAFAQSSTGSVSGIVMDPTGPVVGAAVKLEGSVNASVTDYSGKFNMANIPAGEQTLVISSLGYADKSVTVTVVAGQTQNLGQVAMTTESTELGEIVVEASYRPSQQRALNLQKKSMRIVNVVASDAIGKLPDRNAAEAVQRVPGVSIERDHGEGRYVVVRGTPSKWNANLINGDRLPSSEGTSNDAGGDRAVPLDIFPSEMIQYVEVSKAITPDQEGDAIGGSVNFITRTAPYDPILDVAVAGGYNDQAEKGSYNGSIIYGDRFLDGKLGVIGTAAIWSRNWATDNYEVTYNAGDSDPIKQYSIAQLELRDYDGQRNTAGLNLGLDYKLNDNNTIFARGIYSNFSDNESAREYIYNFNDSTHQMRTRNGIVNITLSGGEVGGDHQLNENWSADWKLSSYQNKMSMGNVPDFADEADQGYMMATFQQSGVSFGGLASDGGKYVAGDGPSGYNGDNPDNIQPNMITPFIPQANVMTQMLLYKINSYEQDYVGQFNVEGELNTRLRVKAGAKYRSKYREGGTAYDIFIPGAFVGIPGANIPFLSDMETESRPTSGAFLGELGGHYEDLQYEQITQNQLHNLLSDEAQSEYSYYRISMDETNPSTAPSFYHGTENVIAGYVMADYKLNEELTVIGGVRNEVTSLTFHGNSVVDNGTTEEIEPISDSKTYNAFLPMLHLKYSPNAKTNLRAAYTRTFARPDFASLNPGATVDAVNRVISSGNPELDPTFSNNFDVLGEYFFDNVGIFSAGVFFKDITNDIYNATSQQTIDGFQYLVNRPENIESAWLFGAEFGFSHRFDYLENFLGGFGVEGNYTFTESEANVPSFTVDGSGTITETVTKQSLPSQAKHIYNASVFYEKHGLLVRIAANYKGAYTVSYSEYGANHNRWYDENLTVDFSAAYTITPKLRVFAEVNNLTNAPMRYYHGNVARPEQVEYYSIRGQVGVRYSFF